MPQLISPLLAVTVPNPLPVLVTVTVKLTACATCANSTLNVNPATTAHAAISRPTRSVTSI